MLLHELAFCLEKATAYRRNYFAWTTRLWVLRQITDPAVLMHQVERRLFEWIRRHVSDYSAVSHRQQAMLQLLHRCEDRRANGRRKQRSGSQQRSVGEEEGEGEEGTDCQAGEGGVEGGKQGSQPRGERGDGVMDVGQLWLTDFARFAWLIRAYVKSAHHHHLLRQ